MKKTVIILSTLWVVILCCQQVLAQDKKPLKDWDISEAKKPEHTKIVKFLKEQKEIIKEDSIRGIVPAKEDKEEDLDAYYEELGRRVVEQRQQDSLLMTFRPPVPEWDKPLVADSITGEIGPKILECYWMNEFGDKITKINFNLNPVLYCFVRTQCYPIGSKITVTLRKKNGEDFNSGEKTIVRYIYTDEDGIAILAHNIWR